MASGLGLIAGVAGQALVATFRGTGLRAQGAAQPSAKGSLGGAPRGSGSGSRRFPNQSESCSARRSAASSTLARACCLDSSPPAWCTSTILPATYGRQRSRCYIRRTMRRSRC